MSEQQEITYSNIVEIRTDYSPDCATIEAFQTDTSVRIKRISMTYKIAGKEDEDIPEMTLVRKWPKNDKGIVLIRAVLFPLQGDRHFTVTKIVAHLPKGKTAQIKPPPGYTNPSIPTQMAKGIRNVFGILKT